MYVKLYSLTLNPQAQGNLLGDSAPLTLALKWGEGEVMGDRGHAGVALGAPCASLHSSGPTW